ncbi:HAMP domain-containing sensor histidine kinase [Danxiaibacter flavus]|uniref:histidine kinase n=1 Tax=Danxiaibacter flavus TaxID=3049108 RepID=A0ABV3ZB95_9BACT|nr:HAMP domain-containing sensor histidine kinase [Chitinophagaceae bacterium DXS]
MNRLRTLAILMVIAIAGITGFQVYWLKDNYDREHQNLQIKTNASFYQTVLRLQTSKLKLDSMRPALGPVIREDSKNDRPVITIASLIQEKMRESDVDSTRQRKVFIGTSRLRTISDRADSSGSPPLIRKTETHQWDSAKRENQVFVNYTFKRDDGLPRVPMVLPDVIARSTKDTVSGTEVRMMFNVDSLYSSDSVTIREIDSAYSARLNADKMNVAFSVSRINAFEPGRSNDVTIGLAKPVTYRLSLQHVPSYIFSQLKTPLLFSILLVGITIASFVLLYSSLVKQRRLTQMKNDLISNITHELKTPIATVSVAVEALKNFKAMDDPERTQEYLNISQNELQRLSLLVDKVLKLSMFENKSIALEKEYFDLAALCKQVINSMKWQFEKQDATITFTTTGDRFTIHADKLHITSVIYNLLDNALKYSRDNPVIHVELLSHKQHVEMRVSDNGIGIPPEYKQKVFEKFFRVPGNNRHDIKGYGLGLSYVDHIAKSHQGFAEVKSEPGKGSTFIVHIPYEEAAIIEFDENRKIIKKTIRIG